MPGFDAGAIIGRLEVLPVALPGMVLGLTDADARWKPAAEHWSVLEVCCHLLDEEREDFRVRLRSVLEDPSRRWKPLGLDGIADRRGYNQRDLRATVSAFVEERRESVSWLRSLISPLARVSWEAAYEHERFGAMHAGMLLASWAAHDALHMRQISKRLYELARRDSGGWGVRYAGEW